MAGPQISAVCAPPIAPGRRRPAGRERLSPGDRAGREPSCTAGGGDPLAEQQPPPSDHPFAAGSREKKEQKTPPDALQAPRSPAVEALAVPRFPLL